jgi:hypothetical protein
MLLPIEKTLASTFLLIYVCFNIYVFEFMQGQNAEEKICCAFAKFLPGKNC